jgi:hypothetical protein
VIDRVVVIAKRYGRLANRMFLFAHLIGAAAERGFTVLDPAFVGQARYFPATARALVPRFPERGRTVPPFPGGRAAVYVAVKAAAMSLRRLRSVGEIGAIRLAPGQRLDLDDPAFLDALARYRVVVIEGWRFRDPAGCDRHRDVIRRFFTPFEHHLRVAREAVETARRADRLLVGVHVRRADYRQFKDGRFLYSHRQYGALMRGVQEAFPEREASFLVCSDEPVPGEAFRGFDVHLGPGHELHDLYALAGCDLLLGPPSTYTGWASYYGDVPVYQVHDPGKPVRREAFAVFSGLPTPLLAPQG